MPHESRDLLEISSSHCAADEAGVTCCADESSGVGSGSSSCTVSNTDRNVPMVEARLKYSASSIENSSFKSHRRNQSLQNNYGDHHEELTPVQSCNNQLSISQYRLDESHHSFSNLNNCGSSTSDPLLNFGSTADGVGSGNYFSYNSQNHIVGVESREGSTSPYDCHPSHGSQHPSNSSSSSPHRPHRVPDHRTAEGIGLRLLQHLATPQHQLPKASELQWLVSERDAPQKVLRYSIKFVSVSPRGSGWIVFVGLGNSSTASRSSDPCVRQTRDVS